jgi:hypothetical protein
MYSVTFKRYKRAPLFKDITYPAIVAINEDAAILKAAIIFMQEHDFKYYDRVAICETRILRG